MNTNLPLDNNGLVLKAINGSAIKTPPAQSISLLNVIRVEPGSVVDFSGNTIKTVRVTVVGTKLTPDTYDFAVAGESDATATAGFTVGSVTAGDKVSVSVNGEVFTYTTAGGNTAASIKTSMDALIRANNQNFTFTSSNNAGVILYNFTAPAGSGSYWNGFEVTTTFPTNVGPTFSAAVETNFGSGIGVAEQFQTFLTAQGLTSYLPIITGLLVNGVTTVKNGPSFMLNSNWITSATYNGTNKTVIAYKSPLEVLTTYTVAGRQTALTNTFNV